MFGETGFQYVLDDDEDLSTVNDDDAFDTSASLARSDLIDRSQVSSAPPSTLRLQGRDSPSASMNTPSRISPSLPSSSPSDVPTTSFSPSVV